jgi:hypothetical protein
MAISRRRRAASSFVADGVAAASYFREQGLRRGRWPGEDLPTSAASGRPCVLGMGGSDICRTGPPMVNALL